MDISIEVQICRMIDRRKQFRIKTNVDKLKLRNIYRLMSASMLSLIASLQALWQISVKSAPEKPLVILARKVRSTWK